MRLVTLARDDREIGAVVSASGALVPLPAIDPGLPDSVLELLELGLTVELRERLLRGADEADPETAHTHSDARLGPLLRRPRKIIGIGLNYREHADDLAAPFPETPASFFKGDHTIIGPGEDIVIPRQSDRTTAEAELGVVFGKECWQVDEAEALDYVAGFCAILDQTAEDILALNPRYLTRAKNFPSFLSLGATLVTTDEVLSTFDELGAVAVATVLNGETARSNVVANMAFSPEHLVSFHSKVMPFFPGDVISTGTPGAVVLKDGDVVTCRIPGLVDELTNPVREAN